ncbi:MAG TPA: cupredoxin domain-containing protein [Solirubrobacterales bacterium]|nr:cupredoxin domain-containing protein [Solirubrobacterales bacterium]
MKRFVACVAFAVALLASQAAPAAGPPAGASAAKAVRIEGFEFLPGTLRVNKGARVVFTNSSSVVHTATDRGAFDTGRIKAGGSVAARFRQRGTFRYHCKIHPFMRGKIVVG